MALRLSAFTAYARGDHVHPTDTSRAATTYVDSQDALKVAKTGDTMTGSLTINGGNFAVSGNIIVNGAQFASGGGIYTNIQDRAANVAIIIGNGGDPANYYRNTSHTFGSIVGGANYAGHRCRKRKFRR